MISNYYGFMKRELIIFLIGRIQYKANKFLIRELNARHMKGLAPSHGEILGALICRGPLPMSEIARIIDKDKSTITALVNKLIKLGYVQKSKDSSDARISLISLTEKGAALKPDILLIGRDLRERAYQGISDEEGETLIRLLTKVDENL
jgi:DNA-binding MarR family transcriptional regulator